MIRYLPEKQHKEMYTFAQKQQCAKAIITQYISVRALLVNHSARPTAFSSMPIVRRANLFVSAD